MDELRFAVASCDTSIRRRSQSFASSAITALLSRFGDSVYKDDGAIRIWHGITSIDFLSSLDPFPDNIGIHTTFFNGFREAQLAWPRSGDVKTESTRRRCAAYDRYLRLIPRADAHGYTPAPLRGECYVP